MKHFSLQTLLDEASVSLKQWINLDADGAPGYQHTLEWRARRFEDLQVLVQKHA